MNFIKICILIPIAVILAASCSTLKPADFASVVPIPSDEMPAGQAPEEQARAEPVPAQEPPSLASIPPEKPVEPPELPVVPTPPKQILGSALVGAEKLSAFFMRENPKADQGFVRELAELYVEEAGAEGVSHEVAFIQMCLETGFLSFQGLVTPDMNNFCGLGSIGPGKPGERFPTPRIGVRAHVQHLKGYATEEPPVRDLVDPRYRWIRYGSAPMIADLAGRWASDPDYGSKLEALLRRLYSFTFMTGHLSILVLKDAQCYEVPLSFSFNYEKAEIEPKSDQ